MRFFGVEPIRVPNTGPAGMVAGGALTGCTGDCAPSQIIARRLGVGAIQIALGRGVAGTGEPGRA